MRVSPQRTEVARKRVATGYSQKEMAGLVGVTPDHYRKIELGSRLSQRVCDEVSAIHLACQIHAPRKIRS